MCAVVWYNGALQTRIFFFKSAYLILFHIYRAEYKIHACGDLFGIGRRIQNRHILYGRRYFLLHTPFCAYRLSIGLSGRTGACGKSRDSKPRVIAQQRYKTLSHHAGGSDYSNIVITRHLIILPKINKAVQFEWLCCQRKNAYRLALHQIAWWQLQSCSPVQPSHAALCLQHAFGGVSFHAGIYGQGCALSLTTDKNRASNRDIITCTWFIVKRNCCFTV